MKKQIRILIRFTTDWGRKSQVEFELTEKHRIMTASVT